MPPNVPIPKLMASLPRDRRGYPIPAGVWRDSDGNPHFTINDEAKRLLMVHEEVCPICGTRLLRVRWFVGGPQSAFHPHGAYRDLPMHRACARYALQVCPYLAAPEYSGRIDARTVKTQELATRVFLDPTQDPRRPPLFVAVATVSQKVIWPYVKPGRPYLSVEFWRCGKQLTAAEAERIVPG